jgi:uncharacterized membrane protein
MALASSRSAWIDWMRGFACLVMFQTHCYDAWLVGDARNTTFLKGSQLLGTLPAPLFLFLAGISFALVTSKLMRKNLGAGEITRVMVRRGAEIFAFGLLFRLQEYLIAWGWAPWSDLFRVDVLNIIGLSMILMALACGLTLSIIQTKAGSDRVLLAGQSVENDGSSLPRSSFTIAVAALGVSALFALLTPPLYTTWRPTWLPWQLESYIDGCHNLGAPQPWLFPLFPWAGFAFAGLAAGFVLFSDWGREHTAKVLGLFSGVGAVAILAAWQLDRSSVHVYSVYDYWHTSPNFFMMRAGILLLIAFLAYAWCNWALSKLGDWATRFSPLIQLGQASLLVYWVHIEFVYGRFSLLPKRAVSIATATRGLVEIFVFMLILSILRTRVDWKSLAISLRARFLSSQPAA